MARTLEQAIEELIFAADRGDAVPSLRKALRSKRSLLVAAAAKLAAAHELGELSTDLADAFDRFARDGAKRDKGCHAKKAIIKALASLGHNDTSVFERGVLLVQMEPVWGGREDTAGPLRIQSAEALARLGYPDLPAILAHLLADRERSVRAGAAQLASFSGRVALAPLLRLRVLVGDDPEVLGECYRALLDLEPDRSLLFVAGFLDDQDHVVGDAAALALGSTRSSAALAELCAWHERNAGQRRDVAMLAISTLRIEEAYAFLLETIEEGSEASARAALEAMATYRELPALRERTQAAVDRRGDREIATAFRACFEP